MKCLDVGKWDVGWKDVFPSRTGVARYCSVRSVRQTRTLIEPTRGTFHTMDRGCNYRAGRKKMP